MNEKKNRKDRGHAFVELAWVTPLLLLLGLGATEFGNIFNSYMAVTHIAREAGSVISRETDTKGSQAWVNAVNADFTTILTYAAPVINLNGTGARGPSQFKVIYSVIEWNPAAGSCVYNPTSSDQRIRNLGTNCNGQITGAGDDFYHIRSVPVTGGYTYTDWAYNPQWTYGTLPGTTSKIGANGDCACKLLPQVKQLSTQGLTLHSVEVFYSYAPSTITGLKNFLKTLNTDVYYGRSIFVGTT